MSCYFLAYNQAENGKLMCFETYGTEIRHVLVLKSDCYSLAALIGCALCHSSQAFSTMRVMAMSALGGITWWLLTPHSHTNLKTVSVCSGSCSVCSKDELLSV